MRLTKRRIVQIQAQLLGWYAAHRRDLPWRRTLDPYRILVSEVMLQQTQVSRVIPKYHEFLARFPALQALAAARVADVVRAWRGLGYNRRALNLQCAARVIVKDYASKVPADQHTIRALPGVGRYTAGAILNFAFGIDTPAVDTNVKRFIDHFVSAPPQPRRRRSAPPPEVFPGRTKREYYELAERLMPAGKARVWLHAVMDYSALVLRKNRQRILGSTLRVEPRKSAPFVGSNRYLRGRTLDRLRDGPSTLDQLFAALAAPHGVGRSRYEQLINALDREGFIQRRDALVALNQEVL